MEQPALAERFERLQSVIFLAFDNSGAIGFAQLYPSFSSGAMAPIFILNDLFVASEAHRRGPGSALLEATAEYARSAGAIRSSAWINSASTTRLDDGILSG